MIKTASITRIAFLFLSLQLSLLPLSSTISTTEPGVVPVPGKPVYIEKSNTLWVFSFSRNSQADNKLYFIDLNQSFNTLSPPVKDISSLIRDSECPVMHFAQALPDADGVSVNIFGAGSNINGVYSSTMTICEFNTETSTWKQINNPINSPLARRNAAFEVTSSNLTFVFGGSSEPITGLSVSSSYYPNYWHQDVAIYDSKNEQWLNTGLSYTTGSTRANATITQISDTNGQLLVIGGSVITNTSSLDMVTNFPLANMSDIVALDPRTSSWNNIRTQGNEVPIGRKHHTTTLHPDGRTLIVIGGEYFNASGAFLLNDVWTLDTRDINNYTWSQPAVKGIGLYRSNHTSILIGDHIWVIAGTNSSSKAVDIQLLNIKDWTWSYLAVPDRIVSLTANESYAGIGGVKGLIGIVVGSVGGLLLTICLCFVLWWLRKKRVKPSNNALTNAKRSAPDLPESTSNNFKDYQEGLLKLHDEDQPQIMQDTDTSTTKANSKLASLPSMSTNASNSQKYNMHPQRASTSDWSRQPNQATSYSMNNISAQQQLYGTEYKYTSESSPPMPSGYASDGHSNEQYEDNTYYFHDDHNASNYQYRVSNSPPYNNNSNRRSIGFWDAPALQATHFARESSFMLSPVHGLEDSIRPSYSLDDMHPQMAVQHQQHLQKPNEADTSVTTAPAVASPAGSITACASSSSILDDSHATDSTNRYHH